MRITRDALLKNVNSTIAQRTRSDRSLLAVYLCGTLLGDDFLLGGAADIDLVFIHLDTPTEEREIVRLTDEIHLDIAHHFHRTYRRTRELRIHPWLGPTIRACKILFDPQHFMDFTQASVRGQFYRGEYVLERARRQADKSRQIWLEYQSRIPEPGPAEVSSYLRAVYQAANAIASLSGAPLTERRFLLGFQERAEAVRRPGLFPGALGLLGTPNIQIDVLHNWLKDWQSAFDALPEGDRPARLHPNRQIYYRAGIEAILQGEKPFAALWPLLNTWTLSILKLPDDSSYATTWRTACQQLGFLGEGFPERLEALDAYLDQVEETLEEWAQANGISY